MASPYTVSGDTIKKAQDEESEAILKSATSAKKDRAKTAKSTIKSQKDQSFIDAMNFATDITKGAIDASGDIASAKSKALPSAVATDAGATDAVAKPDLSTKSGRIGARADDLQSRAEVAGASGRLLRQAKLTDRAAALDQRVPEMQRQELLMEQQRRDQFAEKVDDRRERSQKRLDRYNIRKEYGQDRKVGAYRADGDLYTAQPQAPDTSAEIFDPRYKASDDVVRKRALALMSQEDDLTEDEILSSMMSR
tara:strand:- start:185 stop:940 length:756 start_codon:yes stop_codon:yes gene_type:complete